MSTSAGPDQPLLVAPLPRRKQIGGPATISLRIRRPYSTRAFGKTIEYAGQPHGIAGSWSNVHRMLNERAWFDKYVKAAVSPPVPTTP